MLETIKEVLISSKKQELKQKEEINKRIDDIKKEEHNQGFELIDKQLTELEKRINNLTKTKLKRVFHGKEIYKLYVQYTALSHSKMDKINQFNMERDELLKRLHDLSHNEVLIEMEIEKIKNAKSLEELGITKEQAISLIKKYTKQKDQNIIKTVFSEIQNNQHLETKEDILKCMQILYQTNCSSFVLAMKKILPMDLISILLDIGITIDEDKVVFLKELAAYTLSPNHNIFPMIQKLQKTDSFDFYYYNEIEKELANMERYATYSNTVLSQIMTLSVLVSMAKSNKKLKKDIQTQK